MPRIIEIADARDPAIEIFRDIRERDVTGRGGFIAEGAVVVEQLLSSRRFRPTALLILRNRLAGLATLLDRVPESVPVHVADREVIDAVAGFAVHRGVLAHGEGCDEGRRPSVSAELSALAGAGRMIVAAIGIANHDNIGAIFRNAAAFGAGMVLLDETSCHPLYRKAIRVSAGSVLQVPFARMASGGDIAACLRDSGFRCLALTPGGRTEIDAIRPAGPIALFLGTEGEGLPESLMASMETVAIGMEPGFDSLNVATAAAIALHRLRRGASGA